MELVRGENFRNEFPGTDVSSIKPDFKNNVIISFEHKTYTHVYSQAPLKILDGNGCIITN